MKEYSEAAMERMMKVQEIILGAMSGKLKWFQAGEIIGISPRQMQRLRILDPRSRPRTETKAVPNCAALTVNFMAEMLQ